MSKGLLIYFVVVCLLLSAILLGLVASSVDSFLEPKPVYHMEAENVIQEQQPRCRWIGNSCVVMQNIP